MKNFLFLLLILIFFSCKNNPSTNESESTPNITSPQAIEMIVYMNDLRLRDAAGENANEIARLPENTKVTYQGELSEFTTKIKLRGMQYDEPWLKVETTEGKSGWVYAAGVKPATSNPSEVNSILEKMRLQSFFGKDLFQKIETNNNTLTTATDSKTFASAYENSLIIRDQITEVMSDKIELDDPSQIPAMDWLENAIPSYTTSIVAEGTKLYLFADYFQLWKISQKTQGNDDDEFMKLQMSIFPIDSIEHFFPVWFLQTWDYGGHSLLGEGHHFKILKRVDELLTKSSLFKTSLISIKTKILDDITDTQKYISYWYTKEKILSEIKNIINANFVSLSQEEKIALKARSKMFKNPKANSIKVNQRSGQ